MVLDLETSGKIQPGVLSQRAPERHICPGQRHSHVCPGASPHSGARGWGAPQGSEETVCSHILGILDISRSFRLGHLPSQEQDQADHLSLSSPRGPHSGPGISRLYWNVCWGRAWRVGRTQHIAIKAFWGEDPGEGRWNVAPRFHTPELPARSRPLSRPWDFSFDP